MLRGASLFCFVAGVIVVIAIAWAVRLSLDPRHYFFYETTDRTTWVYRPGHVAFVCAIMVAEAALVWGVFVQPRPALWFRCAIGLSILGPWALLSTSVFMHTPGYVLFHHLWVWLLVGLLMLAASASVGWHVYRRLRRAMTGAVEQPR